MLVFTVQMQINGLNSTLFYKMRMKPATVNFSRSYERTAQAEVVIWVYWSVEAEGIYIHKQKNKKIANMF